jgi:hypothetical protein
MPAEAVRLQRRIGQRDRRFFAALACAAVIGTPAIVLAGRHGSGPATRKAATCVDVAHAGVLGGGAYHYCGAAAVAFCRRFAGDASVAAKCETLGRRTTVATPR